jgi:hypothetical protein
MYTKKVDLFSARFVQRTDMKVSENILKILFKNSILACLSLVKNVLIYSKSRVIHLIITELVAKDEVTRLLQLNAEYIGIIICHWCFIQNITPMSTRELQTTPG